MDQGEPKSGELYEIVRQGGKIHDEFWSARSFESALSYFCGSHLALPESLIRAGEKMHQGGHLHLPAPEVILEFETRDQEFERFVVLCQEFEPTGNDIGLIMAMPLLRQQGRWTEFMLFVMLASDGQRRCHQEEYLKTDKMRDFGVGLESMTYCLTLGAIAALQPGAAKIDALPASEFGPRWRVAYLS